MAPEQNGAAGANVSAYPVESKAPNAFDLAVVNGDKLTGHDLVDGKRLWDVTLPGPVKQALIADLNGDHHDDLLYWFENTVAAVALNQGRPEKLWSVEMPARVWDAIVADTKGDGGLEVVATCGNGFVYGLNQPASECKLPRQEDSCKVEFWAVSCSSICFR